MKTYGANKATEFTKKQINVVFAKAKNGELKVEKWYIQHLYELADYYGYDYNRSVEDEERFIKEILDSVFANDIKKAQSLIDSQTEKIFNLLSRKNRENADKSFV